MIEEAFHELRPTDFPFAIELMSATTGETLWSRVIPEPGAITIPSNTDLGGGPIDVRMTYPNGQWVMCSFAEGLTSGHS